MEFLTSNTFETTTAISVNSNTITADNLLSWDIRRQYISSGFADDTTTTVITVSFSQTTTVNRIAMLEHNAKEFSFYYNGATANAFTLTGPTTTSSFNANSATSNYFAATPVDVTSVTFEIKKTIVANSEKAMGYIYLGENLYTFERVPSADNYKPVSRAKELVHELSDGGTRRHLIQNKWDIKIKFDHISEAFKTGLKEIYDRAEPVVFVPFGTTTAWDKIIFEANWTGNFDFYEYTSDAAASGYSGSIPLKET